MAPIPLSRATAARVIIASDNAEASARMVRSLSTTADEACSSSSSAIPVEARSCGSGEEAAAEAALACSAGRPFAAAVIDLHGPEPQAGVAAAQRIRAADPHIELVFLAEAGDPEPQALADKAAPAARLSYGSKPLRDSEVRHLALSAVDRWCAERRLRGLIDEGPAVAYLRDVGGDYAIRDLCGDVVGALGFAADSFLEGADLWRALLHPDDLSRVLDALDAGSLVGQGTAEYRLRGADGAWRLVRDQFVVQRRDESAAPEIVGCWLIGTAADTGATDADSVAGTARRGQSRQLVHVHHGLMIPLHGILGGASVLAQEALSDGQRRQVEAIRQSGEQLLRAIQDVLDLTKMDSGEFMPAHERFDVAALIDDVAAAATVAAEARNLRMTRNVSSDMPRYVIGDEASLRRVLDVLISNAVTFVDEGWIALGAAVEAIDESSATLRFSVSDSGEGLSASDRAHIFEPFVSGQASAKRREAGPGLGLALAQRLVALMGGEMDVDSDRGKGSTFWFTVRMDLPSASDVEDTNAGADGDDGHRPPALVVEPDPELRERIMFHLRACGLSPAGVAGMDNAAARLEGAAADGRAFRLAFVNADALQSAATLPDNPGGRSIWRWDAALVLMGDPRSWRCGRGSPCEPSIGAWLSATPEPPEILNAVHTVMPELRGGAEVNVIASTEVAPSALQGRILIAEDNLVSQEIARESLRFLGCDAELAEHGGEAVEAASRGTFDVILMDCQMPHMDGFEATRRIRELESEMSPPRRTPIIALTAAVMPEDRAVCHDAGMDDFLGKPFTPKQLEAVLRRWLR